VGRVETRDHWITVRRSDVYQNQALMRTRLVYDYAMSIKVLLYARKFYANVIKVPVLFVNNIWKNVDCFYYARKAGIVADQG
jgi:hypothetical protein